MLYITCSMIPNVDLAYCGASRAKDLSIWENATMLFFIHVLVNHAKLSVDSNCVNMPLCELLIYSRTSAALTGLGP